VCFRGVPTTNTLTMTEDTGTGRDNIYDKFLGRGDTFGLRYNQGIVFLEVEDYVDTSYAPYSQLSEIDAQSSTGFTRLNNEDNDDILYSESQKLVVKHVGIGHYPSVVRRYTNYPESETRLRTISNLGVPTPGDDYGYVDGDDMPYPEPTDAEELWIPPDKHLDFNFFNASDETVTPVLNIVLREYKIRPLDPNNRRDLKAIKAVLDPSNDKPVAPVGSADRQDRYQNGDNWGVPALSRDQVAGMGTNGAMTNGR